jgi:transposase-like protein
MSPSTDLRPVTRAASRVRRARDEYRRALAEAHAAGATFAEIARAVGVSPQAVRVLVNRSQRKEPRP